MAKWSSWRLFPDPRKNGILIAPFGAGCYELKIGKQKLLYGMGKNVAYRMSSLLPKPFGSGVRKNVKKRDAVFANLGKVKYRTLDCMTEAEAKSEERKLQEKRHEYLCGE